MNSDNNNTPPPPLIRKGVKLTGTVTQSGVIIDDGFCFEAMQFCEFEIISVNGNSVTCEIKRREHYKTVNKIAPGDAGYNELPKFYQSYLGCKGSSKELAHGTYDPFNRVLLLKSEWPAMTETSSVLWSPHFYSLVVSTELIVGTAFCMDGLKDRENGVGSLIVHT